jgi:hypothetical protein
MKVTSSGRGLGRKAVTFAFAETLTKLSLKNTVLCEPASLTDKSIVGLRMDSNSNESGEPDSRITLKRLP